MPGTELNLLQMTSLSHCDSEVRANMHNLWMRKLRQRGYKTFFFSKIRS